MALSAPDADLSISAAVQVSLRGSLVPTQKFFNPSHRMFGHIHVVLNVDEKKINCTVWLENHETNLLNLISS
jgi:hypothetical protein